VEFGAAFGYEGVELVEEDDTGNGRAGALEDLAEGALGFTDVLNTDISIACNMGAGEEMVVAGSTKVVASPILCT
jgi:hypothetical protein